MKLNPAFIKFITGILLVVFLGLLGLLYFDDNFVPEFPYKYTLLREKSTEIQYIESEIQITKKRVEEWKERIEAFKKEEENKTPVEPPYSDVIVKKMPEGIDYASLLLFIEEQALLNDVIVSKIDLNKEPENQEIPEAEPSDQNAQETGEEPAGETSEEIIEEPVVETPPPPEHVNQLSEYGVSQKSIDLVVMGDYLKIEKFIKSISDDMGVYNFIETVSLVRGKSEVIDWEKFKEESQIIIPNEDSQDEEGLEETPSDSNDESEVEQELVNKNIIVSIKMVINYKNGGGY